MKKLSVSLPVPELVLPAEAPRMAESGGHRRASSPLLNPSLPPPIPEDEEDDEEEKEEEEEGALATKPDPPQTLPVPNAAENTSSRRDLCSPQFLCVDESKRPRAHSDPYVTVSGFANYILPEITVTEDEDGRDLAVCSATASKGGPHLFLRESLETIRKRSNTCPEDLFRPTRKGRPATPPPTDIVPVLGGKQRAQSAAGGARRFSFNFAPPLAAKSPTGVSFAHHKLSKVSEDMTAEPPPHARRASACAALSSSTNRQLKKSHCEQDRSLVTSSETSTSENGDAPRSQINPNSGNVFQNRHFGESSNDSFICTSQSVNGPQGLPFGNVTEKLDSSRNSNTSIPSVADTSTAMGLNTNGAETTASNHKKDSHFSDFIPTQTNDPQLGMNDHLKTLSLADKSSCDSYSPKTSDSASGIPKDSLPSWRANDKGDSSGKGRLAAF